MSDNKIQKLADRLGASRVEKLSHLPSKSPLGLLQLQREVQGRLRSSGGRPTDPTWTVSRQVPFKPEIWADLQATAEQLGVEGPKVGPAQIAAILVEQSLGRSRSTEWQLLLDTSRSTTLFSESEAAESAGVTYRQFHEWVRTGKLEFDHEEGRLHFFGPDEIVRARALVKLRQLGVNSKAIIPQLRSLDLSGRYLVVVVHDHGIEMETVNTLDSFGEEASVVIDQIPIRQGLVQRKKEETKHESEVELPDEREFEEQRLFSVQEVGDLAPELWEDEDLKHHTYFQSRAPAAGAEFKATALKYLISADASILEVRTRICDCPVDAVVEGKNMKKYLVLARGVPDSNSTSGLRREDTVFKVGFIAMQLRIRQKIPILIVTSHLPLRNRAPGRYLAMLHPHVSDVIATTDDFLGFQRLRSLLHEAPPNLEMKAPWREIEEVAGNQLFDGDPKSPELRRGEISKSANRKVADDGNNAG